jgi:hypothetical protein
MNVESLNGFLYYVIFIDDFSRKTWIYFLKKKDEVFGRFKEFKALVENATEKKIKILRSDNGGEFISNPFKDLCKESGIKREFTVSYNPQQNGVAERKNRHITEAAKAMIHDQGLTMNLWAEASRTAVYIQNRSPHQALSNKTPEEAFSGMKPEVSHLRIFGCPVYIHVPKDKRLKLEPSGKKGIFVGYSETSKAFRIYIPGQRQIEVSRDVTFDEMKAFHKSRESLQEIQESEEPAQPISEEHIDDQVEAPDLIDGNNKRKPAWLQNSTEEEERSKIPRRSGRESKRPDRFSSYTALMSKLIDVEPATFEEAISQQVWKDAMVEEYDSIMKNDVWDVVPRPEGKPVVSSKWIYKIKHSADGRIEKYKARFVARGFSQTEGVDYDETFAPVARYSTIRSILALSAMMGWKLHQMDVKTAFLNGKIEEEVYIQQPLGFEIHGKESHVCRLKKALYGLKQAPRAWYSRIDHYLLSLGFTKSEADPNLYQKVEDGKMLILVLYVDDLFLAGDKKQIVQCKKDLTSEFEMKDLGLLHYFLGLEIWQRSDGIFLSQGKYTVDILRKFGMDKSKPMATPMEMNLKKLRESTSDSDLVDPTMYRQLIGSLMYLVNSRPDICFAVNTLSQFMVEPRQAQWVAAKHVLRYLQGTVNYGLRYTSNDSVGLHGYTDSDWAGSAVDRKSTSGCCFSLGSAMISWMSRKQTSVALSTAEAEYIAANMASREAVWLRKLLSGLFDQMLDPTVIYCDNQSCLRLSENPVFHDKSKHIEIKYFYIRDLVRDGAVKLQYVSTDEQVADILTKPLSRMKFVYFREKLGVVENVSLAEREC